MHCERGDIMNAEHIAYDYDRQEWLQGEPARALLIEQLEAELDLLNSPEGRAYYNMVRTTAIPDTFELYRELVEQELRLLK
jgi:hypothetical protein